YLMTGRRAFLDQLSAQAMWNIIMMWPVLRTPQGWAGRPGADMIISDRGQVRGTAWGLRQLDNAAWIGPDDDPDAAAFREAVAGNWAWLRSQIPAWTAQQGEAHGRLPGAYPQGALPPWQQDYMASTVAQAARRGSEDARAFLAWMTNFLVGRFRAEGQGLPFNDGATYNLAIAPTEPNARPFQTWSLIAETTRERGWSNGDGFGRSVGDYVTLALQGLAQVIDVLDMPEAREAYSRLIAARAPHGRPVTLARNPSQNILPRGVQRFPGRLRGCTPAAPARS
ncbi:MAG: hypothetical protein K2X74_06225, partial [Acetobacteraceae bacterium]|nr:hypothetical protein [Acetobacteraceae bacterium]